MTNDTPDTDMGSRTTNGGTSHTETNAAPIRRECELASNALAPGAARRFVRAAAAGVSESLIERAELVASELVTNAVLHGSESEARIELVVERDYRTLMVSVADAGRSASPKNEGDEGGFGLGIVEQVADDVSISTGAGWMVRAVFTIRSDPETRDGS